MQHAVIFTGGFAHPFEDSAPALAAVLEEDGFRARVSFDLEEILDWLRDEPDALLVVYALRWSMTQHEKYATARAQWALAMPEGARATIRGHVEEGGGLLGIHTASICFDDWLEWRDLLGGAWRWPRSWHPPLGPVRVRVEDGHELARGVGSFTLTDEVYSDLELVPGLRIAAFAEAEGAAVDPSSGAERRTGWQPVLWTHRFGRGRVVCDLLGHDAASLRHPAHRQLLTRAARWAASRTHRPAEVRSQ